MPRSRVAHLLLPLAAAVAFVGCGGDSDFPLSLSDPSNGDPMTDPQSDTPLPLEVSVQQTKALLDSNAEAVLIDCREQDEYDTVKIDRASLVPMSAIESRLDEVKSAGDRPVVVHCHRGGRSLRVAKWLRQNGVPQAQSMAGGIDAWATEIEPGMERY